jgi:UDP-N-acetyl-D-glucosamine dehydrogenase
MFDDRVALAQTPVYLRYQVPGLIESAGWPLPHPMLARPGRLGPPLAEPGEEVMDDRFDVMVIGLGFTGLPVAVAAAAAGLSTVGIDISPRRVREINEVSRGCGLTTVDEDELRTRLSQGQLHVSEPTPMMAAARTYVLCVPTPPGDDGSGDLTAVTEAVRSVAAVLRRGDLVLLQSTCPPGAIRRVVLPTLVGVSGLVPGADFSLAYSPVRVNPGERGCTIRSVPRVVSGVTPRCVAAAIRFLGEFTDHLVPVSSLEAAELIKVFENTFRLVNIALANELAELCRLSNVAVAEVLDAASTKPYGFLRHNPGPGAGGDCVPVAAGFFAEAARDIGMRAGVVEAALSVNEATPARVVYLLRELLADNEMRPLRGSRVLVVGVTYKSDVANTRQSAAVRIVELLRHEAEISYHDPYVPRLVLADGTVLHNSELTDGAADLVLVVTKHDAVDSDMLMRCGAPVIDCSTGHPALLSLRQHVGVLLAAQGRA